MQYAFPDPLYTIMHNFDNINRTLYPSGISRETFSQSITDCRRFTDRMVRNERMACRSLTLTQQIQRLRRWFQLQEQMDASRGVCSLMYLFGFKQMVEKVESRFNPHPTVYNDYNRRNGLIRMNNTTGQFEIVLYKCLIQVDPSYVFWSPGKPHDSQKAKISFLKKRDGRKSILVKTVLRYSRVWERWSDIIGVCVLAGMDFTMMYVHHYRLIHDKLSDIALTVQTAKNIKRRLTFDLEKGYQTPPEDDGGDNTEDEIDKFSKLLLNYSKRHIANYPRLQGRQSNLGRTVSLYQQRWRTINFQPR